MGVLLGTSAHIPYGHGVPVPQDTFTVEVFVSVLRLQLFKVGIEFKFDWTYCTVCTLSALIATTDVLRTGGMEAAGAGVGFAATFAQGRRLQQNASLIEEVPPGA